VLLAAAWPAVVWLRDGSLEPLAALSLVAAFFSVIALFIAGFRLALKRDWIVDTPFRRGVTSSVIVVSTVSHSVSWPVVIWDFRLCVALIVVLSAALFWPPRRAQRRDIAPGTSSV